MAYEVIARKWRPRSFAELVGQDAITRTLRNSIAQGRLHHAYLFTGARGVGKTTTARILAKSLNCRVGVTEEPCGTCPSCTEVAAGNSMDVIEIDAASHTGVDNIRDVIISTVNISPARDRYKVFIIDEVHQLSPAAFNAMLKTLEEPPPQVVFILATTELHKVPDTIVSRCQLFEFRSIALGRIQNRLAEIAADLQVTVTPAALSAIARAGEGSMRDAQSALDQVIAYAGERIDLPDVTNALGIVGDSTLYEFLAAISAGDRATILRLASSLVTGGHDLRHFVRGMMRAVRNVLVVRAVGFDEELVDAMEADRATIEAMARELLEPELVRMFAALAALEQEIRLSSDPRFQLELGMVRLAEFPRLRPLDDVLERLERLESRLGIAAATGSKPALPPASSPSSIRGAIASAPASGATVAPTSVETGPGPGSGSLKAQLVAALENAGKGLAAVTIEEAVAVTLEGSKLAIRYSRGTHAIRRFDDPAFRDGVTAVAGELFHTPVQMEVSVADEAALANAVVPPATPPVAPACDDPMVQTVIEVFRGRLEELRPPETDKTT